MRGCSAPRPGRFTLGKDPVPIVQEAGLAPGPVWMCAKNLVPTGIRSPNRPAPSQSLSRPLHYIINKVCLLYISATFVTIFRKANYKGYTTKVFEPVHKYKVLSFKVYALYFKTQKLTCMCRFKTFCHRLYPLYVPVQDNQQMLKGIDRFYYTHQITPTCFDS
jgi:hypothetical protein